MRRLGLGLAMVLAAAAGPDAAPGGPPGSGAEGTRTARPSAPAAKAPVRRPPTLDPALDFVGFLARHRAILEAWRGELSAHPYGRGRLAEVDRAAESLCGRSDLAGLMALVAVHTGSRVKPAATPEDVAEVYADAKRALLVRALGRPGHFEAVLVPERLVEAARTGGAWRVLGFADGLMAADHSGRVPRGGSRDLYQDGLRRAQR